jgi:hypothetical protein
VRHSPPSPRYIISRSLTFVGNWGTGFPLRVFNNAIGQDFTFTLMLNGDQIRQDVTVDVNAWFVPPLASGLSASLSMDFDTNALQINIRTDGTAPENPATPPNAHTPYTILIPRAHLRGGADYPPGVLGLSMDYGIRVRPGD